MPRRAANVCGRRGLTKALTELDRVGVDLHSRGKHRYSGTCENCEPGTGPHNNPFFRSRGAIPMPSVRAEEAVVRGREPRSPGRDCLHVTGSRTYPARDANPTPQRVRTNRKVIRGSGCSGLVDRLSMSSFPSDREKHFFKRSNWFSTPVAVAFGKPISKDAFNIGLARERLLELGELCFENRPGLDDHLAGQQFVDCAKSISRGHY